MTDVVTDPRRVDRADVYKGDVFAGQLTRAVHEVAFAYDPAYLERGDDAVALTLPLRPEPTVASGGAVPPFFAGLLPEGARLNALVARVRTSTDDMLSLLIAVGADTVGDVRVVAAGAVPESPPAQAVGPWADLDFDELFAESVGTHPDRAGLPGVQAKVSASVISFPVRRGAGRSILKLNPPEYPSLVENEHFFLAAARASGLRAAHADLVHDRNGQPGLLVERFDRVFRRNQLVTRVWQEDACQVMDLYPADKYLVSSEAMVRALSDACAAPLVAALELTRQLVFAYLIGNGDLHAKNASVHRDPRRGLFTPTPAYDVLSTSPYQDSTMALRVQGRTDGLTRARWLEFGASLSLRQAAVAAAIDEIVAAVDRWLTDLETIGLDQRRTHELRRGIEYRRRELAG
jgi:serine/threonine-protein kinase HipA